MNTEYYAIIRVKGDKCLIDGPIKNIPVSFFASKNNSLLFQSNLPEGIKELYLQSFNVDINPKIKKKEFLNSFFDTGVDYDKAALSTFRLEINDKVYLDTPLIKLGSKASFFNGEIIIMQVSDKIKMEIKFWDGKPRDFLAVNAVFGITKYEYKEPLNKRLPPPRRKVKEESK